MFFGGIIHDPGEGGPSLGKRLSGSAEFLGTKTAHRRGPLAALAARTPEASKPLVVALTDFSLHNR